MLIDKYMRHFDFREHHFKKVKGQPENIYPLMKRTNLSGSFIINLLFKLKGIPAGITTINDLEKMGFIKLEENYGKEILFGIVTLSWMFNGCELKITPEEFIELNDKGYIKAVINFHITKENDDTTLLSTETRVLCTDESIRKKFRLYWLLISPFSRLIRRLMLKEIKNSIRS